MKKEKKDKNFLDKPYYEGGSKAMNTFLDAHLQYPKAAAESKVKGTVVIRYTINYRGEVIETKVLSGIGHGCDEEATRVVKLLKFQVGRYRNMKVQFHKTIKIHFHGKSKAPVRITKPTVKSITYTVTSNSKKTGDAEKPKPKPSYNYTIRY